MEWIDCSDQLPPECTMVLGIVDGDYEFVNMLGGHLKIFSMGNWQIIPSAEISHWMFLPKLPSE